jgi:hypothetical protein
MARSLIFPELTASKHGIVAVPEWRSKSAKWSITMDILEDLICPAVSKPTTQFADKSETGIYPPFVIKNKVEYGLPASNKPVWVMESHG